MKKISVVVPVYNTKEYLCECVDSIINQTYENIEIVLVDDGSNDGSAEICDKYGMKYSSVKVIHKKNGGLQSARSAGIKESTGEYIGFVDSDDWIERDMYKDLMEHMGTAELVTSGIYKHSKRGNVDLWKDSLKPGKYDMDDAYYIDNLFFCGKYDGISGMSGGMLNNLVCKVFLTKKVKEIYVNANKGVDYEEDLLFLCQYLLKSNSVSITDKIYYHYRYNEASITNSYNRKFFFDKGTLYNSFIEACSDHKHKEIFVRQFQKRLMYELNMSIIGQLKIDLSYSYPIYRLPYEENLCGKKIVIFGAGKVGIDYYFHMRDIPTIKIEAWIDSLKYGKTILGRNIGSIEALREIEFDKVVCAVVDRRIAAGMIDQILGLGIDRDKVLWVKPVDILFEYYREI